MEEHGINTEENKLIKCSRGNHFFEQNFEKPNKTCPDCVEKMFQQKQERKRKKMEETFETIETIATIETDPKPKIESETEVFERLKIESETSVILPCETSVKPDETSVKPDETSVTNTKEILEKSLDNFDPNFLIQTDETRHFKHPFSMKIYGMRGVGKTTWLINYMNEFNYFWDRFILISPTSGQDLFDYMNDASRAKFKHLHLAEVCNANELIIGKTIIVFDDCMADLLSDKALKFYVSQLYLRGRHPEKDSEGKLIRPPVSVVSIEQQIMTNGLKDQRTNSDYFLLNRIMDTTGIEQIRNMIGFKNQAEFFESVKNYCWDLKKPFLVSCNYEQKLRLNFNTGFIFKDKKLELLDLKSLTSKPIKIVKDENYFINVLKKEIIEAYEPPSFRFVTCRTDLTKIPILTTRSTYNDLYNLSEDELNKFFNQSYRNHFELFLKNPIYMLDKYQRISPHNYRVRLTKEYQIKLNELFAFRAEILAKRQYINSKKIERFKQIEKERIKEKYSDHFMITAYPEFYANLKDKTD